MLIQPIQVSPWQANCYLVSPHEDTAECLIVDPGITAAEPVIAAVAERGLNPVAILATHGHLDHVGDAHILAGRWHIPVYLAASDQHLLIRPGDGLGPQGSAMMRQLTGSDTLPPIADVRDHEGPVTLARITVTPFPAPGHTKGSTLLEFTSARTSVVFTGDVLFAGTIGRTDLPGGSMSEMRESLRRIATHFPAETPLLPGHGQPTSIGQELDSNPFLQPDHL
ncbi:MBL fold metallo-hydrolase [Tessaracoccus sp. G1721]